MLVGELESLDDSDSLLDGSTDGEVVDVGSSESTLGVDEEGTSESDTVFGEEDAVSLGYGVVSVGKLLQGRMSGARSERGRDWDWRGWIKGREVGEIWEW